VGYVHFVQRLDYLAALVVLRSIFSAAEYPGNRDINSEFYVFMHIGRQTTPVSAELHTLPHKNIREKQGSTFPVLDASS
jgi:hypothetical protein